MSKKVLNPLQKEDFVFLYDQPFKTGISFIGDIQPPLHLFFLVICPMVLYVLCLYVVFPTLRPKTKEAILNCDKWRFRHNVFMCLYSLGTFLLTVRELMIAKDDEIGFIYSFDPKAWRPMMCNKPSELMYWVNGVFIVSKIVEWIDSAFIIWLKNDEARAVLKAAKGQSTKQQIAANSTTTDESSSAKVSSARATATSTSTSTVAKNASNNKTPAELSFLHGYHHMTTLFAFILVLNNSGAVKMGPLLNGFVHFLMYWHYASPLPRFIVPFITLSQIIQFFLVMYLWFVASTECGDFAELVKNHPWEYRTPFLFTPVYLIFFVKYFFKRWVLPLIFGNSNKNKNKKEKTQ